jgi:hypothetical protein
MKNTAGKPEENKALGRPSIRQENNIKMRLKINRI